MTQEKDGSAAEIESLRSEVVTLRARLAACEMREQGRADGGESAERYRRLFGTMSQGAVFHSADGAVLEANPATERILGVTLDQLRGLTSMDPRWRSISPDGAPFPGEEHPAMVALRTGEPVEDRLFGVFNPEAEAVRWILASATPEIHPGADRPHGVIVTFTDVTAQKTATDALAASEGRFRSVFDESPMGLFVYELQDDGRLVFQDSNAAASRILGVDTSAFVGMTIEEAFPPLAETEVPERYRAAARDGERWSTEQIDYRDAHIAGAYEVHAFQTEPGRMAAFFLDITERKRAEVALQDSEATHRAIFNATTEAIFVHDADTGAILDVNQAAVELFGHEREEFLDASIGDLSAGDGFSTEVGVALVRRAAAGETLRFDWTSRHRDGTTFWTDVILRRAEILGHTRVLAVARDVTERKMALQALEESRAQYQELVETIGEAIFTIGADRTLTYVSPVIEAISGYRPEEMIGASFLDFVHPDDVAGREETFREILAGRSVSSEFRLPRKGGGTVWVRASSRPTLDASGVVIGTRGTLTDITERRRVEEERRGLEVQLRHQQKLESIGTLAAGVAHEINNPLTGIMNYAQLIANRVDPEEKPATWAKRIVQESERVSVIVRDLLAFSRQEKQSHSPALVGDIVSATLSLVRTVLRKDQITLDVDVPDSLPRLKCRSQQIQQVLLNLITNARDALNTRYPGHDVGKRIALSASEFAREGRRWIRITVADAGPGIPPDVLERIFDPFFTTKPREQGTGLGLSVSYGLVRDHHGELAVESDVGVGTRFHVELPIDNGWALGEGT